MYASTLTISLSIITFISVIGLIVYLYTQNKKRDKFVQEILQNLQTEFTLSQAKGMQEVQNKIAEGHIKNQQIISDAIQKHMTDVRAQVDHSFKNHAESLTTHLKNLTEEIRKHLHSISTQVNTRLTEGFEKTSSTFTDIVKRLTIIDEAQKKITELSTHVVSLQDVLTDKKSRGAYGEVQLSALIANMIPANHYSLQHTLSNNKRADCILFLPNPTGNIVIDAKFPLESYQKLASVDNSTAEKKIIQQQFKQDVQKHIRDIAEKYIIQNETTDGAMMFIPAEAIFAEIHAHYPEIISLSQKLKVWLVSPSTLMAVLTTARAVLKDDATKKQVHIIQEHLQSLAQDFVRFEKRMDNLSKHINQAHKDVSDVNTSAKKISQRFHKIEAVEIEKADTALIEET